ncbi:PaaI family thioesterase [Williamsia sp.]|uniref:PaaI family thioesterase n=1 Tax=Williamsia sp. TaxID=1872085 RepID=UPI001A2F5DF5|nr:PaaI family thioesterase [Williamsia sp.]MBJ7287904.1 PaaI family thioesterase [Williamsia sp.]
MTSTSRVIDGNALTAFGVGGPAASEPTATLQQRMGPAVTDHRGRIELSAYAVLVDTVGGGPFVVRTGPDFGVVQARLAFATTGDRVPAHGLLTATATLRDRHDMFGLTTVDVTGAADELYASVLVRNARTARTFDPELLARGRDASDTGAGERATVPDTMGTDTDLPPRIDPALTGRQIVDAIVQGRLSGGPIADLLSLTTHGGDDGPTVVCSPQSWMANPLGTMHGGVIAAITAHACSLAGQQHTAAGQNHTMIDFAVNFFRSPPVDAGELIVTTRPERIGRRLGSVSAVLTQADGTLLARATADLAFG